MRADVALHHGLRSALALTVLLCAACEGAPYGLAPETSAEDESYEPVVQAPDCRGNNDGVIEYAEMPFVEGAVARVRVRQGPVTVDVLGFTDEDGDRRWDFSVPDPEGEPLGRLQLQSMEGQWFQGSFPQAEHAGPLVPGGKLLGPLRVDDDGVRLYGSASSEPDPAEGRTLVVYDVPVVLYPFPLQEGTRAVTQARASNAVVLGLPTALDDNYEVEVTGRGTLVLPDLILRNTLRVTVRLQRVGVVGDARQVTHVWVHECLGEVARVISEVTTLAQTIPDDFTTAKEVWRLSL
ncbi:MAG: hypothetical protein AB2A00_33765 [Myxococcota bacterium]